MALACVWVCECVLYGGGSRADKSGLDSSGGGGGEKREEFGG